MRRILFLSTIAVLLPIFHLSAQIAVHNAEVGKLAEVLAYDNIGVDTLTAIRITGVMDSRDFKSLEKAKNTLRYIDLEAISIFAYEAKSENNTIPTEAFRNFHQLHTVKLPTPEISPKPITAIGIAAFRNCTSLRHIKFPETLQTILDYAFYNTPLESITLPQSLRDMRHHCFGRCSNLTSIHIPASVAGMLGGAPFPDCNNLKEITLDQDNKELCLVDGVLFDKAKHEVIQCPARKEGVFVFPRKTKKIKTGSFNGSQLKEIVFSDTILISSTSLSFRSMNKLETVRINYINMLNGLPNTIKNAYIADKTVPGWRAIWIARNEVDLSKITLYVRPELIADYKKASSFGPAFTYVDWAPTTTPNIQDTEQTIVYPNPVKDSFTIGGISEVVFISLTDMQGKIMLDCIEVREHQPIPTSHLPKGVYSLKIVDSRGKEYKTKILK